MAKVRTHYDNLKLARNAPPEVIHAAYKTLSKKYHPDHNENSPESQRVMKILNESYSVLCDPEKRRKHDLWIAEQEGTIHTVTPENDQKETVDFPLPRSGQVNYSALDKSEKEKILERVSGANKNQHAIKLNGTFWNYIWVIVLSGWFVYLFYDANGFRWEEETFYWYVGFTVCAGVLLGININWLYLWHTKPLKSFLIITPLYIIKTHLDKLWYWPIWTVSDIKATHNYRNGLYQNTSLSMIFDGKQEDFFISPESAYQMLLNSLKRYNDQFRAAVKKNNIDYFFENDDFINRRTRGQHEVSKNSGKKLSIAINLFVSFISLSLFSITFAINFDQPEQPAYKYKPKPIYNAQPKGRPVYVKPLKAPNGSVWPTSAAYVNGYSRLNTDGLSSVTVDNSQNDSDVFVKLVSVGNAEAYPIRVFYIPAYKRFEVKGIAPGQYDVRYRDLNTGGLARTESFTLEETATYNGTRYSDLTMTLYKVRNGNMQTYSISESEF